jgi:hypothetical protein
MREKVSGEERKKLLKKARRYFVLGDRLWKRRSDGKHQLVIQEDWRLELMRQAHDELGHKGRV